MSRCYAGLGPSRTQTGYLRLVYWARLVGVTSQARRFRVRSQLFQSRCLSLLLAKSSRVYPLFPPRGHKPPPTFRYCLNPHLCLQHRRFPILGCANAQMLLCTQSVHTFSFSLRPLRPAPSNNPPPTRINAPTHRRPLVRNAVSILSQPVIPRTRLYEFIRLSGLLPCAPMMRSKTRRCTVRSL